VSTDGLHALAEETSLELHRAVAARLIADPSLVERARSRIADWLREGSVARTVAEAWAAELTRPIEELATFLVEPSQRARDLRQTSPFAGFLKPRARWELWRGVRRRGRR
jgi:hypothetical protein